MNKISIAVLTALLFTPSLAGADQIDGDWCSKEGRRLNIDGPKIRNPSGTMMTGEYDCHNLAYVSPKGEPGAGSKITIEQLDDNSCTCSEATIPNHGNGTAAGCRLAELA